MTKAVLQRGGRVKESAGAEERRPHQRQVFFCSVASVSVTTPSACCGRDIWQIIVETFNVIKNFTRFSFLWIKKRVYTLVCIYSIFKICK